MYVVAVILVLVVQFCCTDAAKYHNVQKFYDEQIVQGNLDTLISALQNRYYQNSNGLWNGNGWWNSGNSLEVICQYMMYTGFQNYTGAVSNTFSKTTLGQTLNDYYDDRQWWAIAWLRAYELTNTRTYIDRSIIIWNSILGAWDSKCNGGVYWSTARNYKNAITNELFLFLSTELYRVEKNSTYLDWAKKEWAWFQASGMINSQNLVNDGLTNNCANNGQTTWTYNQGVILGGLVGLAQATGDNSLISLAKNIADAAIATLIYSNGVLKEPCEDNGCGADGPQFKGIFTRYLGILTKYLGQINDPKKDTYLTWLALNANSIITNDKTSDNLCGVKWIGPPTNLGPTEQTSAADCLNAVFLNGRVPEY